MIQVIVIIEVVKIIKVVKVIKVIKVIKVVAIRRMARTPRFDIATAIIALSAKQPMKQKHISPKSPESLFIHV